MVVLNFTLFVLLGMFLVFFWAMGKFVFRPLLEVMDRREEKLSADLAGAEQENRSAEQSELVYASKVAALHRDENRRVRRAHWEFLSAHNRRIIEIKEREHRELEGQRLEAMRQIELQRDAFPAFVEEVAQAVSARLRLKRGNS